MSSGLCGTVGDAAVAVTTCCGTIAGRGRGRGPFATPGDASAVAVVAGPIAVSPSGRANPAEPALADARGASAGSAVEADAGASHADARGSGGCDTAGATRGALAHTAITTAPLATRAPRLVAAIQVAGRRSSLGNAGRDPAGGVMDWAVQGAWGGRLARGGSLVRGRG